MTDTSMEDRPLVTFALFAYNQEQYVREAIEGAFSQTYEPLEIILSDDCSSDRTFEIMTEMVEEYAGPHIVHLRKNIKNFGVAEHVNQIVNQAQGEFLVAAAGDDVSMLDRTERSIGAFTSNRDIIFTETGYSSINAAGDTLVEQKGVFSENRQIALADLVELGVKGFCGATRTYNLKVLHKFPPLSKGCPTEDSVFLLRCLIVGKGAYLTETTVKRRTHGENLSSEGSLEKMNFEEIWSQYKRDAEYAFRKSILTPAYYVKVVDWIDFSACSRELMRRLRMKEVGMKQEFSDILFNQSFGYQRKFYLILYLVRHFFRKVRD